MAASNAPSSNRIETVPTVDGHLGAFVQPPPAGHGPAVVLVQEIFGVNDYIRAVAQRLALLGYVVAAPDLYWRLEPGVALGHDDQGMAKGMELARRLEPGRAVEDLDATVAHLRTMPEVVDRVGVVGFCLGGTLAFHLAAHTLIDATVSYYGSGVPDALDALRDIDRPILFHFGGADQHIPRAAVDRVARAAADSPVATCHVHEGAGHAFDNHDAAQYHQPRPAVTAWGLTAAFLEYQLRPGDLDA